MQKLDEMILWLFVLAALQLGFLALTGDDLLLSAALAAPCCLLLRALAR